MAPPRVVVAVRVSVLVALLAASGCGTDAGGEAGSGAVVSAKPSPATPSAATPSTADSAGTVAGLAGRGCTARALTVARGRQGELRGADASGDAGTPSTVVLTLVRGGSSPCADTVVVRRGQALAGLDVAALDLDLSTAQVVDLGPGAPELVRIDSVAHPRGGFVPHLFAIGPDGPVELTEDGEPLLGFVATDGGGAPMTARCSSDGTISVVTAFPSEPRGVAMTWDLRTITYDVVGGEAVRSESVLADDGVPNQTVLRRMPDLVDTGALFVDCSRPLGD